jgi:formamidopyrimidine-DNA glycosylase
MPELPEVETVVIGLRQTKGILQQKITNLIIRQPKLRITIPDNTADLVIGNVIYNIYRRAKYAIIELDNAHSIIIHLGMSGRLSSYSGKREQYNKHDHVSLIMDSGVELTLNDPRRFGLVTVLPNQNLAQSGLFINLGPEPLEAAFDTDYLHSKLLNKKSPIKTTIMDNSVVVGVGNIYASESLFRAGISPIRPANSLTYNELELLIAAIKETLIDAIKAGGSTLRDYRMLDGSTGYFQHTFRIYDKAGESCIKCKQSISKIVQQGRATYWCTGCQT